MIVTLSNGRVDTFHRSVRDAKGNVIELMAFARGEHVELNKQQQDAVKNDIGHALMVVNKKGKPDKKQTANTANDESETGEEITKVSQSLIPESIQKHLIAAGIEDLADLADLIETGTEWHKDVPGVGAASALEVKLALQQHEAE